ncbi:MAG TPA: SIR2 family protein [Pirellulales bacterium]|nr:SIR2 family protein [Pirellulales bacterium]
MASADHWQKLFQAYHEQGVVLALGAGLSIGCKIPGWEELLARLASRCLGAKGGQTFQMLLNSGYSFQAITSILKASCHEPDGFNDLVREELYRDFPFFPQGAADRQADFVQYVQQQSPTLRSIATLCATRRGDAFACNRRIHAAMNFNLDCILRAYDMLRFGGRVFRTIERASAEPAPDRINLYQVHGYLVFNSDQFNDATTETTRLTITEHEYYDFFNSTTGLFTYTFLFLLREYPCLFLGMSMRDDNVRRLLHYSTKERILGDLEEGRSREEAQARSVRHFAMLRRSDSTEVDELTERSLASLGAAPLWLDDYDEIPARLAELYAAGGEEWGDVW